MILPLWRIQVDRRRKAGLQVVSESMGQPSSDGGPDQPHTHRIQVEMANGTPLSNASTSAATGAVAGPQRVTAIAAAALARKAA